MKPSMKHQNPNRKINVKHLILHNFTLGSHNCVNTSSKDAWLTGGHIVKFIIHCFMENHATESSSSGFFDLDSIDIISKRIQLIEWVNWSQQRRRHYARISWRWDLYWKIEVLRILDWNVRFSTEATGTIRNGRRTSHVWTTGKNTRKFQKTAYYCAKS